MKNTWTLCYEEQFYAVVGIILLLSVRRFFIGAAIVAVATLVARHWARAASGSLQGFFCDGHWLLFAMGILVYYRLQSASARFSSVIFAILAAMAVYAGADYCWTASPFERHLDEYLCTSAVFSLLLIVLFRKDREVATHRWLQPLASYGKMSYSVYLTHYPVVVVLSLVLSSMCTTADWFTAAVIVPLSVALSVPLGRAFYLAVERHFMNAPLSSRRVDAV